MFCPYCNAGSKVTNSRQQKRLNSVWRRRQCSSCQAIWTTHELIKGASAFKIEQDGKLVDFSPEKLLISLYESLKHRNSAEIDAQYIQSTVIRNVQLIGKPIISVQQIIDESVGVLKRFDKLASDLYCALHRESI